MNYMSRRRSSFYQDGSCFFEIEDRYHVLKVFQSLCVVFFHPYYQLYVSSYIIDRKLGGVAPKFKNNRLSVAPLQYGHNNNFQSVKSYMLHNFELQNPCYP